MPYNYPENIIRAVGVPLTCGKDTYVPLSGEEFALLEARIASLPDKHRTALLLHYRDGMTYKTIVE